jgi:metal-responsive CopG/Arc/MetJ family transcriptional regulator
MGDLAAAEDSCVTELDRARQAGDLISQSFCLDLRSRVDQIRKKAGCPRRADLIRPALQAGLV